MHKSLNNILPDISLLFAFIIIFMGVVDIIPFTREVFMSLVYFHLFSILSRVGIFVISAVKAEMDRKILERHQETLQGQGKRVSDGRR